MEKNRHNIGFFFKWCFDRIVALIGLVVLFLPLLIIAILIKLDSNGPIFFMQTRIGKNGKPFRICKFRTMTHQSEGDSVTVAGDLRVTRIGQWLRHSKVDCLTELIIVIWPDKVKIHLDYLDNWSFIGDIKLIFKTIL